MRAFNVLQSPSDDRGLKPNRRRDSESWRCRERISGVREHFQPEKNYPRTHGYAGLSDCDYK